jgi:hypothetical protein
MNEREATDLQAQSPELGLDDPTIKARLLNINNEFRSMKSIH